MRYKIWNALGFGGKTNSASDLTPKGLREAVKDHIRSNPHELDMDIWDCGTVACIAGHAARISKISLNWFGENALSKMTVRSGAAWVIKWPRLLQMLYKIPIARIKAEAACMAIDHFTIDSEG